MVLFPDFWLSNIPRYFCFPIDTLLNTLTVVITFFPDVLGLSYCKCIFLVTRPYTWNICTIIFFTLWPSPWSIAYFWKTLTLAITFIPDIIGLSYCTCAFLVTRPFTWYHTFLSRDLEVRPSLEKKTLTLAITFFQEVIGLSYHTCVVLVTWPRIWCHKFLPDELDLEVWPGLKNLNLGHNFLTRSDGAFILHMCIPCDKTYQMVP